MHTPDLASFAYGLLWVCAWVALNAAIGLGCAAFTAAARRYRAPLPCPRGWPGLCRHRTWECARYARSRPPRFCIELSVRDA